MVGYSAAWGGLRPRPAPGSRQPRARGERAGRQRRRRRRAGPGRGRTGRAGLRRLSSSAATAPGAGSPRTPAPSSSPPQSHKPRSKELKEKRKPPDDKIRSPFPLNSTDCLMRTRRSTLPLLSSLKTTFGFTAATRSVC